MNSKLVVDLMRWGPFRATQSPSRKERESPGLTLGSAVVPGKQGRGLKRVPRGSWGLAWQLGPRGVACGHPGAGRMCDSFLRALRPDSVELGAEPQARDLFSVKGERVYSLT